MKTQKPFTHLVKLFFFGFLLLLNGCASGPSIHDAINVLRLLPIGTSNAKTRETILSIYPERVRRDWVFVQPPKLVTKSIVEADKVFMVEHNKLNYFTCVYPPDLFEKMPSQVIFDGTSYFKESRFEMLGMLNVYFDNNTNYIGFTAATDEKIR
jgi:hypothetical protein